MNKNILIFDDDKVLLDVFKFVLESSGYFVNISEDANNVIEKVEKFNPHVIIMDNWIPDKGGVAAIQLIKAHAQYKSIPIILCSANDDLQYLMLRAGANASLSKPFDLSELESIVEEMFQLVKV